MRWLLGSIVGLGLLAPGSSLAQSLISQTDFRDRLLTRIAAEMEPGCLQAEGATDIRWGREAGNCEGFIYTENAYRQYRDNPADLEGALTGLVKIVGDGLRGQPPVGVADRDRLVPVLRPSNFATDLPGVINGRYPDGTKVVVSRAFIGDLSVLLALDSPTRLAYLNESDMLAMGLNEDEAFAVAQTNLERRIGPVDRSTERGVEFVAAESALATGLLTQQDACRAGDPERLFLVIDRGTYISVPTRDAEAMGLFLGFSADLIARGESMSSVIFSCADGAWQEIGTPVAEPTTSAGKPGRRN
jgi:hypothetical protein